MLKHMTEHSWKTSWTYFWRSALEWDKMWRSYRCPCSSHEGESFREAKATTVVSGAEWRREGESFEPCVWLFPLVSEASLQEEADRSEWVSCRRRVGILIVTSLELSVRNSDRVERANMSYTDLIQSMKRRCPFSDRSPELFDLEEAFSWEMSRIFLQRKINSRRQLWHMWMWLIAYIKNI